MTTRFEQDDETLPLDWTRIGVHGVRLKKFEEVVEEILKKMFLSQTWKDLVPSYLPIPQLPDEEMLPSVNHNKYILELEQSSTGSIIEEKSGDNDIPTPKWPFNKLPYAACVRKSIYDLNNKLGKLKGFRAVRKEEQLSSLIQCILAMLPPSSIGDSSYDEEKRIRIVDFAGGTGHLALPLALLLPRCDIVLVDLKAISLEFMHKKTYALVPGSDGKKDVICNESSIKKGPKVKKVDVTSHSNTLQKCENVPNLYTFHGTISTYADYTDNFDIGIALHACGEATDLVLRACEEKSANFIVSPCCVGKLNTKKHNPYIYHATASNEPSVAYPQSTIFQEWIPDKTKFDVLAKAADYAELDDMRTCRNASRRTAKSLLEQDRLLYMKEHGYTVALTRMEPWECSPKNDILMGWMIQSNNDMIRRCCDPYFDHGGVQHVKPCPDCNSDIMMAINQLILPNNKEDIIPPAISEYQQTCKLSDALMAGKLSSGDAVDWTKEEEDEYKYELYEFINDPSQRVKRFPIGMTRRHRKCVHFCAAKLNLNHWCEGKKNPEKIVVVGKKGTNSRTNS